MCSIYGAFGPAINDAILTRIVQLARDRGRDGGRVERYELLGGNIAALGNWRATPTTEVEAAPFQPYGGVVHNGTIANDRELGARAGEVDSMVLPRILLRSNLDAFASSLARVKGSFAIAAKSEDRVFLAANYKPLHYVERDGTIYFASMERHLAPAVPWGARAAKLAPYTALDLLTRRSAPLRRAGMGGAANRALVVCSAGLDSTTVAYMMRASGYDVTLLHFLYGCRAERREAVLVQEIADRMGVPFAFLSIDYTQFAGASPLLTSGRISSPVEGAEFAHEWVPARNLLMLAHAVAYAEANGFGVVALGNNLEESGAYPDNEEEFTHLLDGVLDYAVHDGAEVRLAAPVGRLMKHEIVATGAKLGVPYELTWSCYRGGERHCGECGPCYMRKTAFKRNGLADPVFGEAVAGFVAEAVTP